jgi:hypothetical protein
MCRGWLAGCQETCARPGVSTAHRTSDESLTTLWGHRGATGRCEVNLKRKGCVVRILPEAGLSCILKGLASMGGKG